MRKGDCVANRYVLERQLGGGSFGTTYSAYDLREQRRIAIKFQHLRTFESKIGHESNKIGFKEEADILRNHRKVRGIPKYFRLQKHDEGWLIAMELVDGVTVSTYADEGNSPMEQDVAVSIIAQVAETISALHQNGYVHRDIKPGNTMINRSGDVYVIDFGSTWAAGHRPKLREGTAGFAAPEQARPVRIGTSADVFSMGCMLVALLTLHLPYPENYLSHARKPAFPPPRPDFTHLPEDLTPVVSDMIRWDPKTRIQTAAEVADRLRCFLPRPGSPPNPKLVGADPTARYRCPAGK